MGVFGTLFGQRRRTITREEAKDLQKFLRFGKWWLENDPLVRPLGGALCTILWNEGFRPTVKNPLTDPAPYEAVYGVPPSLPAWFLVKLHLDLTMWLSESSKEQFREYIDLLDRQGTETLTTAGSLMNQFGIAFENSTYEREMAKFPDDETRDRFKQSYLTDTQLGAEIRVLAWLYQQYFGEAYKLAEDRVPAR